MKTFLRWLFLLPITEAAVILFFLLLRWLNNDGFEGNGLYYVSTVAFIWGWLGVVSVAVPYSIAPSHKLTASAACAAIMWIEAVYCLVGMIKRGMFFGDTWGTTSFVAAGISYTAFLLITIILLFKNSNLEKDS